MISSWLRALPDVLRREPALVLLTIIRSEGSTPREAGASMLVTASRTVDTIGGGHLEWQAVALAREMLVTGQIQQLKRYALGASLGQCCGGVVWVLCERIEATEASAWAGRLEAIRHGARLVRTSCADIHGSSWRTVPQRSQSDIARAAFEGEHWAFVQELGDEPFHVQIFGAGHVGEAIVRALAPVEANVTWVDSRDEMFPAALPRYVQTIATDSPESEVDAAQAGTYFLVVTHSHALDLILSEHVLKRNDFAYFGLIGSRSKRASFERKLSERGVDAARFADMTCPIGIPGIRSKEPAMIAVAVVAQLLQVRESRATVQNLVNVVKTATSAASRGS